VQALREALRLCLPALICRRDMLEDDMPAGATIERSAQPTSMPFCTHCLEPELVGSLGAHRRVDALRAAPDESARHFGV